MKAVKIEPYNIRSVVSIPDDNVLESLQNMVGGYIEAIYQNDGTVFIVNEEGRLLGLEYNIYDYVGNIIVLRNGEEDFESLTDDDINKYMQKEVE